MPSTRCPPATRTDERPMTLIRPDTTHPWLCVLASGSSGNCSVMLWPTPTGHRAALIDMGLSPRRTSRLLAMLGLDLSDITDTFLTHLDTDHLHAGWIASPHLRAPLRLHKRHIKRAVRQGFATRRTEPFEHELALPGLTMRAALGSHDELGVCAFRFCFERVAPGASSGTSTHRAELGFATDVGRMTQPLIDHLAGVDVLAIESNYCPALELASDRPEYLKRRIMGGSGHLSNAECAEATRTISPRSHVVLIHLSRQCNHPDLALKEHAGAPYAVTISTANTPTKPIHIPLVDRGEACGVPAIARLHTRPVQHLLFATEASA